MEADVGLFDLPPEVLLKILAKAYVPVKSLIAVTLVCRHLNAIANEPRLWRAFLLQKWRKPELSPLVLSKLDSAASLSSQLDWRKVYCRKALTKRAWKNQNYQLSHIPHKAVTSVQLLNKSVVVKEEEEEGGEKRSIDEDISYEALETDGWDLVSGDNFGVVRVWDMQSSQVKRSLDVHGTLIWWLEVQGDICVTACRDGTVGVTDLANMKVLKKINSTPTAIWCVDFSIEDDVIVSGGENGDFRAFKLSTGEQISCLTFPNAVFDVRYIPKVRQCIVATVQKTFDIVSVDDAKVLDSFAGHTASISSVKLYGEHVLSGADDETVRIWSLEKRECLHTLSAGGLVYDLRLCENKLVGGITGPQHAFLRIWNYKKKKHLYDIQVTEVPTRLFSLSVLPTKIYCCTREAIHCVDFKATVPKEKEEEKSVVQRCTLQ